MNAKIVALLIVVGLASMFDVVVANDVCKLPLVTGKCKAYFERYGSKDGKCEKFVYGGCGSNGNNFETEEACKAACG